MKEYRLKVEIAQLSLSDLPAERVGALSTVLNIEFTQRLAF